ncbi:MAG: hypothetical protein QXS41_03985 [Candidatus Woesearchaeota archaeon]
MKVLIYNVGVSDLRITVSYKYNEEEWFRINNLYEVSKKIFNEGEISYDDNKLVVENLDFTIKEDLKEKKVKIKKLRFEILDSFLNYFNQNVKIILIGTNQNPNDVKDTLFVAKLMSKYLESKKIQNEVLALDKNPTELEVLINFYSEILKNLKKDEIYVNLTTGTPMQALALALLSKNYKINYLYKPMKEEVKEVIL